MSQYPYPPGPGTGSGATTGLSDDALTVTEPGADSAYATSGQTAAPPPTTPSDSSGRSTTDIAKDEAAGVGDTASEAGRRVAGTAKEQAGEVVGDAKDQARTLLDRTRGEVNDQASTQQTRAAESLRSLSSELHSMASSSQQSGTATQLAHEAADRTGRLADWLSDREPGDVLHEVSSFARRRPGTFLAIAAGAGVLAGRLTRGMAAGAPQGHGTSTGYGTTSGRHSTGSAGTRPFTRPPSAVETGATSTTDSTGTGGTGTAPGNDVMP